MPCIITEIINNNTDLDTTLACMSEATDNDPKLRRRMYVGTPAILAQKYDPSLVLLSLNDYALFDFDDDNKALGLAAKALHNRFEQKRNIPLFISELETNNMVAMVGEELMYVVHLCVKPNSKKYQVTCFGAGIGPIGDKQHDTIEAILDVGFCAQSKIFRAKDIPSVEQRFYPG